jgi:hypothetical protein
MIRSDAAGDGWAASWSWPVSSGGGVGYHRGDGWFAGVPPWAAVIRLQPPAAIAPAASTVAMAAPRTARAV